MTTPRHLWSGDWERESAQVAEPLTEGPAEEPRGPAQRRRPITVPLRRLALGLLSVLLAAAVVVAAVVALGGSGHSDAAKPAWLGVETVSTPVLGGGLLSGGGPLTGSGGFAFSTGALVVAVDPGGPAAAAGIEPGDIITEIGGRTVGDPAQVNAAIARYRPGARVPVQFTDGLLSSFTTQVRLTAAPTG